MRSGRNILLFVVLVGLLSTAMTWWRLKGRAHPSTPSSVPQATYRVPDMLADHTQVTLILSGSMHAELGPCGCTQPPRGGLSRRTTAINEVRESRKNRIYLLECGDSFFSGSSRVAQAFKEQGVRKAEVVQSFHVLNKYDGLALGEHDFALGPSVLSEILDKDSTTGIATNVVMGDFTSRAVASLNSPDAVIDVYSIWDRRTFAGTHLKSLGASFDEVALSVGLRKGSAARSFSIVVLHASDPGIYKDLRSSLGGPALIVADSQAASAEDLRIYNQLAIVRPKPRGTDLLVVDIFIPKGESPKDWYDLGRLDTLKSALEQLRPRREGNEPAKPISRSGLSDLESCLRQEEARLLHCLCVRVTQTPIGPDVPEDGAMKAILEKYQEWSRTAGFEQASSKQDRGDLLYKGSFHCGNCHAPQVAHWETTAHARAYETLVKERMTGNPECISCHTTGFLMPGGPQNLREAAPLHAVQCEACHVPTGKAHPVAGELGAFRRVEAQTCRGCHTPTSSPKFSFPEFLTRASCLGQSREKK